MIHDTLLVDLDHAQALCGVFIQQGFDQRRLARAARPGEQHVVRGAAAHELQGVLLDALLLVVDAEQVGERDALEVGNGMQGALLMIPAEGGGSIPIGRLRLRAGQDVFQTGEQAFGAGEEVVELSITQNLSSAAYAS